MLRFDVSGLRGVQQSLRSSLIALKGLKSAGRSLGSYTGAPSVTGAFSQHHSFWVGQSGSAENVLDILKSNMRVPDCLCAGAWFTSTPRIGLGMPQLVG